MAHLKKIKIKKLFVEKTKIKKKRGREWLKKKLSFTTRLSATNLHLTR